MNFRLLRLSILGVAVGLGLVAGMTYYISQQSINFNQEGERHLPDLGGPFKLIDQFGHIRTDKEFRGKYMLVYFGYTFCPDICPLGLRNISMAVDLLGLDIDHVVPIFITIDPERDDQESLLSYASTIHSSFVMLTGSQKSIENALKAYNVYAAKAKPDGTMADYLMDHSSLVYLMDRDGQLVDYFPHTESPKKIAERVQNHLLSEIKSA